MVVTHNLYTLCAPCVELFISHWWHGMDLLALACVFAGPMYSGGLSMCVSNSGPEVQRKG